MQPVASRGTYGWWFTTREFYLRGQQANRVDMDTRGQNSYILLD